MKIKLIGDLDFELTRFGIKAGDTPDAVTSEGSKSGQLYFTIHIPGSSQECVVWPENYEVIPQ